MLVSPYSSPLNRTGVSCAGSLTHRCFFNKYTGSPRYPWVSHPQISTSCGSKTVFSVHSCGSANAEGQPWVFCTVLCKGLERPWILVPEGWPGTNPLWTPRDDCSQVFVESKVIGRFLTAPLTLTWFKVNCIFILQTRLLTATPLKRQWSEGSAVGWRVSSLRLRTGTSIVRRFWSPGVRIQGIGRVTPRGRC